MWWWTALAVLLAALALGVALSSAWKSRRHRMAMDQRLEAVGRDLHERALAADRRADDLLARIEKLGRLEARLRLLEVRDLAGEWQRQRGLETADLAHLASALDRLRDDLLLEDQGG